MHDWADPSNNPFLGQPDGNPVSAPPMQEPGKQPEEEKSSKFKVVIAVLAIIFLALIGRGMADGTDEADQVAETTRQTSAEQSSAERSTAVATSSERTSTTRATAASSTSSTTSRSVVSSTVSSATRTTEQSTANDEVGIVASVGNEDDDRNRAPAALVAPAAAPNPEPAPAPAPASAYYPNCAAARAAGAAPLYVGSPGYSTKLDRDRDGVACE